MPSDRQQLNVRLSQVGSERFARLFPRVSQAMGIALSQSQFVELAMAALEEKYPPTAGEPPPVTGAKPKKK